MSEHLDLQNKEGRTLALPHVTEKLLKLAQDIQCTEGIKQKGFFFSLSSNMFG